MTTLISIADMERYRRRHAAASDKLWYETVYREYVLAYELFRYYYSDRDYAEMYYDAVLVQWYRRLLLLETVLLTGRNSVQRFLPNSTIGQFLSGWR